MTRWRVLLAATLVASLALACFSPPESVEARFPVERNLEKLALLRQGMTLDEVKSFVGTNPVRPPEPLLSASSDFTLGNPVEPGSFTGPMNERVDVVLYVTAFLRKPAGPECHFWEVEPLVFLEARLVGWGWTYLEDDLAALGKDRRYLKDLRKTSHCPD